MTQSDWDTKLQSGGQNYTQKSNAPGLGQPAMRPSNASTAPSSDFITDVDARVQQHVRNYVQQYYGVARPRSLSITIPLCGLASPTPGWFTSINLFQYTRIQGWMLTALGPGEINMDLMVSQIQRDQATAPVLTSIINGRQEVPPDIGVLPGNEGSTGTTGTTGDTGDSAPAGLGPRSPAPFAVSRSGRVIRPVAGGTTDSGDGAPTDSGDGAPTDSGDGGTAATDSRYIQLNGYTAFSFDTSKWVLRDLTPPATLHVIINQAVGITMASLGLYMIDLYSKTLPI